MSLAATLANDGMRPASMLPAIKCSSCGDEIEISAMGDHICGKAPPSPKAAPALLTNPFTLRQMNASGTKPTQPSPLQFDKPPPQLRPRAPTLDSKPPRPAPPRINADVANKPFLAPMPYTETPISPAASTRSGSSAGSKPPIRSMTSPMPRIFDPRPPSPELSANLDCAFPPFPFSQSNVSRSSTSSRRKMSMGSERASSRADSRLDNKPASRSRRGTQSSQISRPEIKPLETVQDNKPLDTSWQETKSPETADAEPRSPTNGSGHGMFSRMLNRMNTLKSGSSDPSRRRPSNDDRQQQEPMPLDRRRPSSPMERTPVEAPLLSSKFYTGPTRSPIEEPSNPADFLKLPAALKPPIEKKAPPERPARPITESFTSFLEEINGEPKSTVSTDPHPPPVPLRNMDRSITFPRVEDGKDESASLPTLSRVASEPTPGDKARNSTASDSSHYDEPEDSEEPEAPQTFPARGQSRNEERLDYRLQDAPPVPKPVQLHRSGSLHKPSGSDSSTASSVNSMQNTNTSSGTSPITSAASSMDAVSPLTQELRRNAEDQGMRVAGLNVRNQLNPGMRAEQPKERKPMRNLARSPSPQEVARPLEQSPTISASSNWPLESPMDPAMKNGKLGPYQERSVSPIATNVSKPVAAEQEISPVTFSADDYDPYRSNSSAPSESLQPTKYQAPSKPINEFHFGELAPLSISKSHTPTPATTPPVTEPLSRSQTTSPPSSLQAPPVPQNPQRPPLMRRGTTGIKAICRGCNLPIEGKSVKAADGRLTGRWHKACFTCKTCHEPFTTADFYVIKNNPYCEQHYHEKNGSLCSGCRKGIEGQYLETSSSDSRGRVVRKYHPRCFTCHDCRMVLSEDYFEIGNRVYCERHALAAMRSQPKGKGPGGVSPSPGSNLGPQGGSSLKAERRTTKLMMMS